jgi:hypothetical protein
MLERYWAPGRGAEPSIVPQLNYAGTPGAREGPGRREVDSRANQSVVASSEDAGHAHESGRK